MHNMALKLPQYFGAVFLAADEEGSWLLLPSSITIRQYSATRKHLFIYPQGDMSGLRKQKTG